MVAIQLSIKFAEHIWACRWSYCFSPKMYDHLWCLTKPPRPTQPDHPSMAMAGVLSAGSGYVTCDH